MAGDKQPGRVFVGPVDAPSREWVEIGTVDKGAPVVDEPRRSLHDPAADHAPPPWATMGVPGTVTVKLPLRERVIHGHLARCQVCEAPLVEPLPADWRMTVDVKIGQPTRITPHRPDCAEGRL